MTTAHHRAQELLDRFAVNVKRRRLELGLSQSKASKKAGIDGSHWSRVERGVQGHKNGVSIGQAGRMAFALETTVASLLGETSIPGGLR